MKLHSISYTQNKNRNRKKIIRVKLSATFRYTIAICTLKVNVGKEHYFLIKPSVIFFPAFRVTAFEQFVKIVLPSETYLETSGTSMMELFGENG